MLDRLQALVAAPDVAIGHTFMRPPYGGSNQFLLALRGELERRGIRVGQNVVGRRTWGCILNAHLVDERELRRGLHPGCRVVHRVDGPLQTYRGFDDGADQLILDLNRTYAHTTIVQSRFSLAEHERLGLQLIDPVVVPNAVDPAIFHPPAARTATAGRRIRLISSSWSDNPNKGVETYRFLDRHLDRSRFEYTFVGRISGSLEHGRVVPPVGSRELADLLRAHDIYVTASRNDPCSNALLEGLACGLPALYLKSGGHPELVGEGGVGFTSDEEVPDALERLVDELDDRRAAIMTPSLPEVADRYLDALGATA